MARVRPSVMRLDTTRADVDETELPADLAEAFRRAGGLDERPHTLGAGFRAVQDLLNEAGVTVGIEDMYQPEPTRHAVHVGDTVEHVPCVLDALIVALLVDTDPVEVHSEPPGGGEPVRLLVTEDDVTATPETAVVSFGLGLEESTDPDPAALEDTLNDPDAPLPTTCTVTNAFPDPGAYERWATDVTDAAVMELSVEEAFALSRRVVRGHVTT